MIVIKKPMLACDRYLEDDDINALEFPMIASPKVDGIRCINPDGRVLSRSFKPIKNDYIRTTLEKHMVQYMDGELFAGDSFQKCTSAIMSQDGEPEFKLRLFDFVPGGDVTLPYIDRLKALVQLMKHHVNDEAKKYITMLPFKIIESVEELRAYEKQCLADGFEGLIMRTPDGPYKCGRSTWNERYMLKLKIFVDSEAEVIGFEEQMTNTNELGTDELGHAKRSSAKAGKVPNGHLGKFIVKDIHGLFEGMEFRIGSAKGMTKEMRKEIWENQAKYLGAIVKYKYQPQGVKELPRIPIWLGFRDKDDM